MKVRLEHANLIVRDVDAAIRFLQTAFPEFCIRREGKGWAGARWVHVGIDETYLALNEARDEFNAAIDANPQFAESYFNLGIVLENGGQGDLALTALLAALELDPQNGKYHSGLGAHYYSSGDSSLALRHFETAKNLGTILPPEIEDTIEKLKGS